MLGVNFVTLQSTMTASRRSWAVRVGHRWVETCQVVFNLFFCYLKCLSFCNPDFWMEGRHAWLKKKSWKLTYPTIQWTSANFKYKIFGKPVLGPSFGSRSYLCPFDSPPFQKGLSLFESLSPKFCINLHKFYSGKKSENVTFSPAAAAIEGKRTPPLEGGPRMVGTPGTSVSGSKGGILGPWGPCWRIPGAPVLGLGAVGGPGGTGGVGGFFPLPETNFVNKLHLRCLAFSCYLWNLPPKFFSVEQCCL